jgi:PAS domain S-box-containing protein
MTANFAEPKTELLNQTHPCAKVVRLAHQFFDCDVALIKLKNDDRFWFASRNAQTAEQIQEFLHPTASSDNEAHLYRLIQPLKNSNTETIGEVTIFDFDLRIFSEEEFTALSDFAMLAEQALHAEKQANELKALQDSETSYRSIVAVMDEGVVVQKEDATIVACNQTAERILGLTADQIMGRSSLDPRWRAIHEDGSPFPGETHPAVVTLQSGQSCHNVIMGVHKPNNTLTWISINAQPMFKEGATKPYGVVCTFTDITERKKVELMKNEFISTISHELRTPLTSIRGALSLLVGGIIANFPTDTMTILDIANRNCERLSNLVNDILDIDKIENNQMPFNLAPHQLGELVSQTIEANQIFANQFGVNFELKELCKAKVEVDQERLMQVLTNLLSNAAKFSPPNSTVQVTIEPKEAMVRVKVSDNGLGIPPEFHNRIFQKFAQADSSATRQRGGTGLGLSITKATIEKMGGTIGFDSISGQGATFFFDLPVLP